MISTIPPPRPISVNSLERIPVIPTLPYSKEASRSASAGFEIHDDPIPPTTEPGQPDCQTTTPTAAELQVKSIGSEPYRSGVRFHDLPAEVHEAILDHLFGERVSALTMGAPGKSARNWSRCLRHPRRKVLSDLALISPVWRVLVQDRIYRHIKIKGTTDELAESASWFSAHPHLAKYVRQVEVWVPVWGNRAARSVTVYQPRRRFHDEHIAVMDVTALLHATMTWENPDTFHPRGHTFYLSSHNATLEDIFHHVKACFPEARILTLEGGHCKKPPMIRHFRNDPYGLAGKERLPVLPNIQIFVMRGAWNIMRDYQHWRNLSQALPGLQEWHCAYAKPKIEGYDTIAKVLVNPPPSLLHLNISLEGFSNKENTHASWFSDGAQPPHLCRLLGELAPKLMSLTFTGKVCACFFQATSNTSPPWPKTSNLRYLDLAVKTCCREKKAGSVFPFFEDFSGIGNMNFIRSFEKLVVGAVQSLGVHPSLNQIRIRFIDLDSACPLLNPYFQLSGNLCTGLWSDRILYALNEFRPQARFVELRDGIYPQYGPNSQIIGAVLPRARPLSIHACAYRIIADAGKP
ncbi:hypothetical protein CNMCM8980_006480 [Aspergillus fumigatiaffinis]|uniref:Uncharacterized protein n=1 Tax=Aspergillus fumigatiaffinis TaxID=340414 RepID=A0A8H4MB92_9EURO|nr:hypothetical protein CNMCM5878_007002 [Aspergillus fumigatiaffinis]KAF4229050.1 hypothetical protein CNMCM6457_006641 [Aspergillus fumigatiaffinis]KAF4236927.1 hypothetical protein CNMCM6805_007149 [Aspergillus fumigatiaffinis]KAF4248016.1 hypothetical protein CNMCM8980_006480 [Aspergillus fumigatiaffinis]